MMVVFHPMDGMGGYLGKGASKPRLHGCQTEVIEVKKLISGLGLWLPGLWSFLGFWAWGILVTFEGVVGT